MKQIPAMRGNIERQNLTFGPHPSQNIFVEPQLQHYWVRSNPWVSE